MSWNRYVFIVVVIVVNVVGLLVPLIGSMESNQGFVTMSGEPSHGSTVFHGQHPTIATTVM